jgi:hypothetical protein
MKNLHLLPTDKPSRLHLAYNKDYYLSIEPFVQLDIKNYKSFNIHITNDEEIKVGDWFYNPRGKWVLKCTSNHLITVNLIEHKKIILTTDQDLIKDGVQTIDDEFLEWFVKNPSCEEVEVKELLSNNGNAFYGYKIITPQEETKCTCKENDPYCCQVHGICPACVKQEEPKQETLEEAKQRILDSNYLSLNDADIFKMGAEWQRKQILDFLYSEITERRDYSASKMCEKVVEFIEQF